MKSDSAHRSLSEIQNAAAPTVKFNFSGISAEPHCQIVKRFTRFSYQPVSIFQIGYETPQKSKKNLKTLFRNY